MPSFCPCGSKLSYKECCQPYHEGRPVENALVLMRSRYSAYARKLPQYIIETTHPMHPDFAKERKQWIAEIDNFSAHTLFNKLEILDFIDGPALSFVTFKAHLKQADKDASFTERSRFEKLNNKWLYREGTLII